MAKMEWYDTLAYILLIVGGINWGLVGLFDFNLVTTLFGTWQWLVSLVYILVGLSGLYGAFTLYKLSK